MGNMKWYDKYVKTPRTLELEAKAATLEAELARLKKIEFWSRAYLKSIHTDMDSRRSALKGLEAALAKEQE